MNPVWFEALLFFAIPFVTVRPLGSYMEAVFAGRRTFASPLLEPLERVI